MRARADIDLDAIAANVRTLGRLVAPARVCAVVKAGGYGHGAAPVAQASIDAGAACLAVAHVEEGEALRAAGVDAAVLLLSEPDPGAMPRLVAARLQPTLYTHAGIEAASAAAVAAGVTLDAHLKVDTGMRRVGADPVDAVARAKEIDGAAGLALDGVWTHLAVADEPDHEFTAEQLRRFRAVVEELQSAGMRPRTLHTANSAGAIAHPDARADLVRCGIAVYGLAPSPQLAARVPLVPALTLRSEVSFVKQVGAGEGISYGLRHRFAHDTTVATVTIGYADGVRRRLSEVGGEVLIGGRRHPIVGTITMDQLMVDCGDHPVAPGDEVVLIGRQGDEEITAEEWAERLDTIPYEVVCGIGPRVERRWHRSGGPVEGSGTPTSG
ncbi:alanine racemase [Actinomarinicola tropica]|uniref:Alanine racemase n=1 Tax=Actinomarinicola tropica TaxID=2789776 RepID=A0A5Q2RH86_9ACTN|nr:alanine racemase [Actinomarinicola tropica]QGG93901.1 alanine racemase [Actinomarinicola tropica]